MEKNNKIRFTMNYNVMTKEQLIFEIDKLKIENDSLRVQFQFDSKKSTQTENELLKSEEKYRLLNQFSSDLLNIQDINKVYTHILETLQNLYPDTIILYVSIDELKLETKLEVVVGLEQSLFKKILNFAGFNPVGKKFKLVPKINEYFRKGTFTEFKGGLVDFSSNEFPALIAKFSQKVIGLHKIYTIGIKKDEHLLAAIHFFTFNKKEIPDGSLIEDLVNQSAIIIQKKNAEIELIESEAKFRSLIESSNDGIAMLELDGTIRFVNKRKCEMYGAESEHQLLGLKGYSLVTDSDEYKFFDRADEFQTTGIIKIPEAEMLRLDGSTFTAEIICKIVKDASDKPAWMMITTRDITERIKTEQKLKQTKQTYLDIINTIDEAIFVQDDSDTFIAVNSGAARLYNCSRSELIGKTLLSLSADGWNNCDEIKRLTSDVMKNGKPVRFEFWAIRNNDEIFPKDIIVNKGKYFGKDVLIFTARDITERINTEKQLRESNIAKDKFFSIIAHDLKNPVGSYQAIAKLLYDEYDIFNEEERKDFLKLIKESSIQLYELLENLLIWSRSQKEQIQIHQESINLNEIVLRNTDVLTYSAVSKNIEIVNCLPISTNVYADENMLNTILRNLITNAIKFTPIGGRIEVGLIEKPSEGSVPSNGYVLIYVRDTGVGIDEERIVKLFRIDENISSIGTSGEKGTGLGLILCKEFVEKHGGRIWVESEKRNGSTFYFSLPKGHFTELRDIHEEN